MSGRNTNKSATEQRFSQQHPLHPS